MVEVVVVVVFVVVVVVGGGGVCCCLCSVSFARMFHCSFFYLQ